MVRLKAKVRIFGTKGFKVFDHFSNFSIITWNDIQLP
jgi:hypothetical protein